MSVRTRMKELRARDGLRQADLARKVGVRRETISFVENGEYNPSLLLAVRSQEHSGPLLKRSLNSMKMRPSSKVENAIFFG